MSGRVYLAQVCPSAVAASRLVAARSSLPLDQLSDSAGTEENHS